MNLSTLKYIALLFVVIFIQLFILNNLFLGSSYSFLFQPQMLVFFLVLLPIDFSHLKMLIISFLSGLLFDLFFNSWGVHAAICTFIGFYRFYFVKDIDKEIASRSDDNDIWTSKKSKAWKLVYFSIFIFIYHFLFILIDSLGQNLITYVFPAALVSSAVVFILSLILENLLFKPAKN